MGATLGGRLKEERERLGMNQTDFAAVGGVKKLSQLDYEADKRVPDANFLVNISGIADTQYIMFGVRKRDLIEIPVLHEKRSGLQADIKKYPFSYHFEKSVMESMGMDYRNIAIAVMYGVSMAPDLNDKDIAFVDTSIKEVMGDNTFAFMLGDIMLIKNIQVVSDRILTAWGFNKDYPTITIDLTTDKFTIIGEVVACWRRF
jgi:phage repressor protein C with HTH and peptisase S24 domain